jgi:predicted transcriptional regulator
MSAKQTSRQAKASAEKVTVSLYLDGAVVSALDARAEAEDRSRNYIMERAIKRDLMKEPEVMS